MIYIERKNNPPFPPPTPHNKNKCEQKEKVDNINKYVNIYSIERIQRGADEPS
jgi:hypothetical protein